MTAAWNHVGTYVLLCNPISSHVSAAQKLTVIRRRVVFSNATVPLIGVPATTVVWERATRTSIGCGSLCPAAPALSMLDREMDIAPKTSAERTSRPITSQS